MKMKEQPSHEDCLRIINLLSLDIDILEEIADNRPLTAEQLVKQIKRHARKKNEMLTNIEEMKKRFSALQIVDTVVNRDKS